MDENARKRKRELEGEADSVASSDIDMDIEKEKPREGLKVLVVQNKKQKTEKDAAKETTEPKEPADPSQKAKEKAEKRRQKREQKKEKLAAKKEQEQSKKALQEQFSNTLTEQKKDAESEDEEEEEAEDVDTTAFDGEDDIDALDVTGLEDEPTTADASSAQSNASSAPSAASSVSSIVPPTSEGADEQKPKEKQAKAFKYDPAKQEDYRARLTAKLEQLRAARKADGPDGRPAKNRAELIEARRKKEAERKAAKKASRQVAKEDEERLKAEEALARIRGASGSPSIFSVASTPEVESNFAFGKVAWSDGQQLDEKLSGFLENRKKKGKSDVKTALEAAKKKQARISALDEAKRKEIEEKDAWLAAKKRAQGEKVFDDPKLLAKSVKRLEKEKSKSKQEWKDRITNVQKGKEMRQKKREENLRKRREEKGTKKGGKGKGKKASKPGKKVTKRPGFEGTFKAR